MSLFRRCHWWGEADPIYAAIERHKAAWDAFGEALEPEEYLFEHVPADRRLTCFTIWERKAIETDDPRWIKYQRDEWAACEFEAKMATELSRTKPTTLAGMVAVLTYAYEHEASGGEFPDEIFYVEGHCCREKWASNMFDTLAAAAREIGEGRS